MDAQEVADVFGLGRALRLTDPVARGELGEIRRLETEHGTWAVKKELEPWDDPGEAERSGGFHLACWRSGIPSPRPVPTAGGRFTGVVSGELLRCYAWVDLEDPDTALDPSAIGALLADLHAVRLPPVGAVDEWFEAPIGRREWKAVLRASRAAGAPYADRLADLLPRLVEVESILTPMAQLQVCHLDLWSDNLRRTTEGELCVIDFDNCGPADPSRELGMLLFEFGRGDPERWHALDSAYRDAGGPGRVRDRADLGLTVAQLHHIGHRHLTMWVAARDDEARARSLAGIEEFLGDPLLLADVDRLVDAVTS